MPPQPARAYAMPVRAAVDVAGAGGAAAPPAGGAAVATPTGSQAGDGAAALGGGSNLAGALQALSDSIKSLANLISGMGSGAAGGGVRAALDGAEAGGCGGMSKTAVAGVQGAAATQAQRDAALKLQAEANASAANAQAANTATGEDDSIEAEVARLINVERTSRGLAPVTYNPQLDTAAEKHASHMSNVRKMAHDGIGDGDPGERIRATGFTKAWGENVAMGQTSAAQVVREWMASPKHRENILDPNFRQMGVGFTQEAGGRTFFAQEFGH